MVVTIATSESLVRTALYGLDVPKVFLCSDAVTSPLADSTRSMPPRAGQVVVRVYAATDVGQAREHNEDTFLVADLELGSSIQFAESEDVLLGKPHGLLFLVADGMGGAASGELASSMASALILEALRQHWSVGNPNPTLFAEVLRDATIAANSLIHEHARQHAEHFGMGTTVTLAGMLGDQLVLVQVGDSRAYLIRNGEAAQLTRDQSLIQKLVESGELTPEEAELSERRNIILQALGPESRITVDVTTQTVRRGDVLVLCTDGLSGPVRNDEIAELASRAHDTRHLCDQLIDRANQRGGPDNVTVVAVRFEGDALDDVQPTDDVGYLGYALDGTLHGDQDVAPRSVRQVTPTLSAEAIPLPPLSTRHPEPARARVRHAMARARGEDLAPMVGAPPPVLEARQRAARPLRALLLLMALLVVASMLWNYLRG
jgi:protein phosphatase